MVIIKKDFDNRRYSLTKNKIKELLNHCPCAQCDYAATSKMYLKEHIEAKHEGKIIFRS